jgi:hypothetical protein
VITFQLGKYTVHPRVFPNESPVAWCNDRADDSPYELTVEEAIAVSLAGIHQIAIEIADKLGVGIAAPYPLDQTWEDKGS